tara:strand:- start:8154 stop:9542 length:1389 start_codon:yes stop_codon:yes gene_type:complete
MNDYSDYPELEAQRKFYSIDSEQTIIGSILMAPECIYEAINLKPSSMYDPRHKMIVEACLALSNDNKPIDVVIVSEYFEQRGQIDQIGGIGYLIDIAKNTASISNINAHIRVVNDRAKERAILEASMLMRDVMHQPDLTTDERIGETQRIVQEALGDDETKSQSVGVKEVLKEYIEDLDFRFNNDAVLGVMTGLKDIDMRLQGLKDSELYVIAGRPGSGKSTYATTIMLNAARAKTRCFFASLEMPRKQLMQRMLAATASVTMNSLKDASALQTHPSNITNGAFLIKDMPIEIDDNASTDIADLCNRVRTYKRREGLDVLFIDYLQLMKDRTIKDNLRLEITSIMEKLKALAKDLKIPIVILAQVNRKCEDRSDKRPWNSDLAESGAIEATADVIQFIYRDEYYEPDTHAKGIVEVITRKFRDGEAGVDYCNFIGAKNQIKDLDHAYSPPAQEKKQYKDRGF